MKLFTTSTSTGLLAGRGCSLLALLVFTVSAARGALCQGSPSPVAPAAQEQASQAARSTPEKAAAPAKPSVSTPQAIYLVRSALLTLNDANRSGNYTVLRDLAAPDFQTKNTAADLAQSFTDLRRRNFDLFAAALLDPQFTIDPSLDASGRLRLAGFFPTRPLQISFDVVFQSVGGQWRLLAMSVATPQAPATQSRLEHADPRHPNGLFYGARILAGTAGLRW
jgi:hypothetical protein